jgi:hypothetical protein
MAQDALEGAMIIPIQQQLQGPVYLDLAGLLELARDYSFISTSSMSHLPDLPVEYFCDLNIPFIC